MRNDLWGSIEIPIIVGTGEFGMGKTLFGLSICPGAETLVMDEEGSSLTYRSIGFTHVDMAVELARAHPGGYTAIQRYQWWRQFAVDKGKAGNYRVLMVDPVSDIEQGLSDFVRKNPAQFGLTSGQIEKSAPLFWGVVKNEWKLILDNLRTMYETVYLTVHLRDEFKGNTPTGKREPKGKETLQQLSSLSLWFERLPDPAGNVPQIPSANVLKSRLAITKIGANGELEVQSILPPRLPKATPGAIREYILHPPNYEKLKKDERVHEKQMTEDEKLRLQAEIARNEASAAQSEESRLARMMEMARMQANAASNVIPSHDMSAQYATKQAERAAQNTPSPLTAATDAQIRELLNYCWPTPDEAKANFLPLIQVYGVNKIGELNESQGVELAAVLMGKKSEIMVQRANAKLEASGTSPTVDYEPRTKPEDVPFTPDQPKHAGTVAAEVAPVGPSVVTEPAVDPDSPSTVEQRTRLKGLCERTGFDGDKQRVWLQGRNRSNFKECSYGQIDSLISELVGVELGLSKS